MPSVTTPPSDVTIDRQKREVIVVWPDNKADTFSFALLRSYCPCANCDATKHGGDPSPFDPEVFRDITLQSVEEVGRYALRFTWSDGHDTGIYSYSYFFELSMRTKEMS